MSESVEVVFTQGDFLLLAQACVWAALFAGMSAGLRERQQHMTPAGRRQYNSFYRLVAGLLIAALLATVVPLWIPRTLLLLLGVNTAWTVLDRRPGDEELGA